MCFIYCVFKYIHSNYLFVVNAKKKRTLTNTWHSMGELKVDVTLVYSWGTDGIY